MRILTVRQPWAWAIIHGGKDVENRGRNVAGGYRGPVAIHAALSIDEDAHWRSGELARALGPGDLPHVWNVRGAIIGVVDLVDVHWSGMECVRGPAACHEYELCSPWAEADAHHLVLANPRSLPEPIPFKGALGLRELDPSIAARIEREAVPA